MFGHGFGARGERPYPQDQVSRARLDITRQRVQAFGDGAAADRLHMAHHVECLAVVGTQIVIEFVVDAFDDFRRVAAATAESTDNGSARDRASNESPTHTESKPASSAAFANSISPRASCRPVIAVSLLGSMIPTLTGIAAQTSLSSKIGITRLVLA